MLLESWMVLTPGGNSDLQTAMSSCQWCQRKRHMWGWGQNLILCVKKFDSKHLNKWVLLLFPPLVTYCNQSPQSCPLIRAGGLLHGVPLRSLDSRQMSGSTPTHSPYCRSRGNVSLAGKEGSDPVLNAVNGKALIDIRGHWIRPWKSRHDIVYHV